MATKVETKLVITRSVYEISATVLRLKGGLGDGPANSSNRFFPPTDPRCHGNNILDKMDYNLTYVQYISEIKSRVNLWLVFPFATP